MHDLMAAPMADSSWETFGADGGADAARGSTWHVNFTRVSSTECAL